jgi:CO dehydrogenase maturation factor
MIMVSDHSQKGLRAIGRILGLIDELNLNVKNKHLVINRAPEKPDPIVEAEIKALGVHFAGYIPDDAIVAEYDLHKKSMLGIPEDNPAALAVDAIVKGLSI